MTKPSTDTNKDTNTNTDIDASAPLAPAPTSLDELFPCLAKIRNKREDKGKGSAGEDEESVKYRYNGWLNIDKPAGMTSNDVLTHIKSKLGKVKIGHNGTLDPMATGVLTIALGRATKLIPLLEKERKAYTFTIKWGTRTDSDDAEGQVVETSPVRPTRKKIEHILHHFKGKIMQRPPVYSAVKIDGKRACDMARKGKSPDLSPKEVTIYNLSITKSHEPEYTSFAVVCSRGTYVRSLARDMARRLGTCGHISALRRTQNGQFFEKDTISLDFFEKMELIDDALSLILPSDTVLDDIPAMALTEGEAWAVATGNGIPAIPVIKRFGGRVLPEVALYRLFYQDGLVALAKIFGSEIRPVRLFLENIKNNITEPEGGFYDVDN